MSNLELEHALHLLVEDAQRTIDPHSSPELAAKQLVGYVQRHHYRLDDALDHVTTPSDFAGLTAVVTANSDNWSVALDFKSTALEGKL